MTVFTAQFATDNAAFDNDFRTEVADILRDIARRIEEGYRDFDGLITDSNGNYVGQFKLVPGTYSALANAILDHVASIPNR